MDPGASPTLKAAYQIIADPVSQELRNRAATCRPDSCLLPKVDAPCMSAAMSNGVSASFNSAWPLWSPQSRAAPELFPPEICVQVAWRLPARQGVPLSRWSHRDLPDREAIRPGGFHQWYHRRWLHQDDPALAIVARALRDSRQGQPPALYQGLWGRPCAREFVVSAEKTSIQPACSPSPGHSPLKSLDPGPMAACRPSQGLPLRIPEPLSPSTAWSNKS